jgi:hypothetical protein
MVTTVMAFSVSAFFVLFVFVRLLCAPLHLRTNNAAGDAFVVQTYYNVRHPKAFLDRDRCSCRVLGFVSCDADGTG